MGKNTTVDPKELMEENRRLKWMLDELQETFRAIQHDEVDALVINTVTGERVFALKGTDESYRVLVEQMREGAVMLSAETTVLYSNSGFAKMVNQPLEKIVTSDILKFVADTHRTTFKRLLREGTGNEGIFTSEVTLQRNDNSLIPTLMSVNNVYINGARTTYLVFTDLTQHMQDEVKGYTDKLEEEVMEKTEALRNSERLAAIGETAGMVGHDMRNPLQTIFGELYIAKEELEEVQDAHLKQQMKESISRIEQQANYMNKIIADLQDFARPVKPEPKLTHMEQLIKQTIREVAIPKRVNASVNVQKDVANIMIDPSMMKRILINLINNAVQAIPDNGHVTIMVSGENSGVVLNVKDTGIGIEEEAKNHIFRPLYTTKAKGQGFGLAVVKRLVDAQMGSINFVSERGKGTTFTLRIPLSDRINT